MAEHVQQVGLSQESGGEVTFHDDWTDLAPSINEMIKDDHLKAAIESLDTDANAVPVALLEDPENYFELEDTTNSLWMVPDAEEGNAVPKSKDISSVREDSKTDEDELNLSYDSNLLSQVSLDTQEDDANYVTTSDLVNCDHDTVNSTFQTKDPELEANSLQMNDAKSYPINSKNQSDTLSSNSFAETLNTAEIKEKELSCSAGRSGIIHESDWEYLASSINEIFKDNHLKDTFESLDTETNAVPLALPVNSENYFELDDQTNSLSMVPDVEEGNTVPMCENICTVSEDSGTDQNCETKINLSYNANSSSQVLLDAQEDATIHVSAADSASCNRDSINIAVQTKDQEFEANSLLLKGANSFPIKSIECNNSQYKNLSDTLSQNSFSQMLSPEDENDRELSGTAGKSQIIQEEIKNIDNSSDVCIGNKQNILITNPSETEAAGKYKPQFGNKKRKLPLSEETGEKQCKAGKTAKSILAIETCSVQVASAENETAVVEDNTASHSSTESVSVRTDKAATSDKSKIDSSATNESKSTTCRNELLPIDDKTAKCNDKTIKRKSKPNTCPSDLINESVLAASKSSKITSESVSRKSKTSKTSKGKARASRENQNSTIVPNPSLEKEQTITGIKYFLEHQESLATARNLLRGEQQRKESKSMEMSATKAGIEEPPKDTMQSTYEDKVKTLDTEVSLIETMIEQVKSLIEGEEDHEKCLSLFNDIREKVTASLLLKYPVLVAVLEPIQRYEIDTRIKEEAEEIYKQCNSMFIKQTMEDFVFNFDRIIKFHHRHLAKSEQLAQKILKRILPDGEANTDLTFDTEMWSNLAKERDTVWDRFIQEFQESDKMTVFQTASDSSSPTSKLKEEVEELNNDINSTVVNTTTQEQNGTGKLIQPSCSRTGRKERHSSLKSNPNRAEMIVKPEHGLHDDADVKPTRNKLFVRIKEETAFNTETLTTNSEVQRKQPTRSCKFQNIKTEVTSDEPIIRVKQEIDYDTEIVGIKKEMKQKQIRRSSKRVTVKEEVTSGHEQIVKIKTEKDSDASIQNTNRDLMRIQPRRSCKPNKDKLECRMHFNKRKGYFNKEKDQNSKKARVSYEYMDENDKNNHEKASNGN